MAGMNQESIREMLTCVICMEEFRSPRSLPCLHTFCQLCLGDYLVRKKVRPGTSFACPTCREAIVLPRNGVAGLRSNFLIKSMLGLLETKEESETESAFTEDLLNLDDDVGAEASGIQIEGDEKNKRISRTTLLMYQAKEEKLKTIIGKANRHVDALKQYNSRVDSSIKEIENSKEELLKKIKERFTRIADEISKYETNIYEEVEREMNVVAETKPFKDEAVFVEEQLATLQSILQFSEDILSSGSLETVAAVTDDVVTNVSKIVKRELKELEWKSFEFDVPEIDVKDHVKPLIGSLKKVSVTKRDGRPVATTTSECSETSSISLPELTEEPSVRRPKMSTASMEASPAASIHTDTSEVRIYPKYLADEFLVGTSEGQDSPSPISEGWRGSPLALAGFDDEPRGSPPVPLRSFPSTSSTSEPTPPKEQREMHRQRKQSTEPAEARGGGAASNPDLTTPNKPHRPVVRKRSPTKAIRVTLKLPPADITAVGIAALNTPLDNIHDIAITGDGDICVVGKSTTKEGIFQAVAVYKSTGAQKVFKRLYPYEPSYPGTTTSFTLLNYKGKESIALPLPEDSRIRIIPLEDPENVESVRTIFHKFKNMLYRPFHVCNFNGKLWAFGLDSFGRDSYDSKNKFDEWHPQSRVWDIETVETTEGPVKADMVPIPCASQVSCAIVEETTSTMYLCEKEIVTAVRLSDKGTLLWKFGEIPKKKQKLKQPQGLCADPSSGRVFVACQGGDKIVALSTEGKFLQTVVSDKQGLKKPTAVTIDPAGQLLVAQANGQIKVYRMTT